MSCFRGLYKHIRTGQLYFADGLALSHSDPSTRFVVYSQKYEGKLRETGVKLPVGSMWIQPYEEFVEKFEKVDEPLKLQRFISSITSAVEKDMLFGYHKIPK